MDVLVILLLLTSLTVAASKPNIVFILADDLGWNDVSFHGSRQIPTPNLDALAYDGVILKNYYVQPICTPTRSALMTGRYPIHTGMQHGVIVSAEKYGLALNETLMPQYLKELGYSTHAVGKWHLGFFAKEYTPTFRGFDSHFGYLLGCEDYWNHAHGTSWHLGFHSDQYTPTFRGFDSHFGYYQGCSDYYDHTYSNRGPLGDWHLGFLAREYTPVHRGFDSHYGFWLGRADYYDHSYGNPSTPKSWGLDFRRNMDVVKTDFGKYSTELFSREAETIIANHDASKPLYMYLPHQAVHSGNIGTKHVLEAPWKYQQKFQHIKHKGRRMFAAMVSALDDAVGNVTKALHRKGILNNTVIVFSTDNGGPAAGFDANYASNWPLRGLKSTLWEGGTRGAGFIWSPLLKTSGYTSSHLVHVTDWLPTLLNVAGYDMTRIPADLDGMDQWEVLSTAAETRRTEFLYNIDPKQPTEALKVRDMKVISGRGSTMAYRGWYAPEQVTSGMDEDTLTFMRSQGDKGQGRDISRSFGENYAVKSNNDKETVVEWMASHVTSGYTEDALKVNQVQSDALVESAPDDMFTSDLTQILRDLGRGLHAPHPLVVDCGFKPSNYSTNCNPSKAPCLFNVTADPCEFNNLADRHPEILKRLLDRVDFYRTSMVKPRNKPNDPKGLPYYHGGVWGPWVNLTSAEQTLLDQRPLSVEIPSV